MDVLDEFEFGEMPEDDEPYNEKEEYDANNDMTFGDDIVADFDHPDLGNYADQSSTAFPLEKRFEEMWGAPGRSTDAPDASHVPIPSFAFDDSLSSNPWDTGTNGIFNMWGSPSSSTLTASYNGARPDESQNVFDALEKEREVQMTHMLFDEQKSRIGPIHPPLRPSDVHEPTSSTTAVKSAASEMQGIDEDRRQKSGEASIHPTLAAMFRMAGSAPPQPLHAQQSPLPPYMNKLPPMGFGMGGTRGSAPFPPGFPLPPGAAGGAAPPGPPNRPLPPWFAPVPPEFHPFVPYWMAAVVEGRSLPPGCPPVPQIFLQMLQKMRMQGVRVPGTMQAPPGMAAQSQQRQPFPFPPNNRFGLPSQGMFDPNRTRSSSSMSSVCSRKPPGFPTGKTIEDFAFDPYAGFMSKKEREWLIKIQLLQCMSQNGDPYVEDYYYTCWEKKREREMSRNGSNGCDTPKSKEKKLVPRNYNAPKFSGSLGKPVSSTTTNPRHLIDVSASADSMEGEDKEGAAKKSSNQKKYRTLLLAIENAAVLLLQCEDRYRHVTVNSEVEIKERLEELMKGFINSTMLPKVLTVAKGRRIFTYALRVSTFEYQCRMVNELLEASSRVFSRVGKELRALEDELIPALVVLLESLSQPQLIALTGQLDPSLILRELQAHNVLMRDLLLTVVYGCACKKAQSSSPFFALLRSAVAIEWTAFKPSCKSFRDASGLPFDAIVYMSEWMSLLSHGSTHLAARLAQSLTSE